jgi:hypothetical protein
MYIGDRFDHLRQFYGLVDEVRVSSVARSSAWISTEYANQNDPSSFYKIGPEEIQATHAPIVSAPNPTDGATGVNLDPTLSVTLYDPHGDSMNIDFLFLNSTGQWQKLGKYTNVGNGVYSQTTMSMDSYSTTYSWAVQVTDGTYWTNKTFQFTTKAPPPSDWWNSSWQYRMNITIDHSKVASDISNFSVLVDLTNLAFVGKTQTNGQDFVFTDINNSKLDHQIETYNASTGHLIAWVRIPFLSSATDTTLRIYYHNPTCTDQQTPTGVWDKDYLMVLHLNDGTLQCNDSTVNGNGGTLTGNVAQASGEIGSGLNFTGGYVTLPQVCTNQTQFTFSAWIYAQSGARYFISEWANYQGAFLQVSGDSQVQMYVNGIMVSKSVSLNQWHYVVGTYDGITAKLWLDGGSPSSASVSGLTWPSGQNMFLGDRFDHLRQFYGLVDEVRVSSVARSSAWISTEYANQNDPSSFYTIGPEESFSV